MEVIDTLEGEKKKDLNSGNDSEKIHSFLNVLCEKTNQN